MIAKNHMMICDPKTGKWEEAMCVMRGPDSRCYLECPSCLCVVEDSTDYCYTCALVLYQIKSFCPSEVFLRKIKPERDCNE